jgi:hypothetical protein
MRWTRMLFIPAVAVFALGPVPSIPTRASTAACTIVGTNGHDVLHGTGGADVMCGRAARMNSTAEAATTSSGWSRRRQPVRERWERLPRRWARW